MRLNFGVILCFFLSQNVFAVNYYFSSSAGNDNYTVTQAQNRATPWKTIDKLNASMSLINPGDSILFIRGDVFTGQIVLTRSGNANAKIVFSAYGSGKAPVIKGTLPITGWTRYDGDIWVADCPQLDTLVTDFFIDGISQQIGRYPNDNQPNNGYLNVSTHIGRTSITSSSLTSAVNWTQGVAVIRTERWCMDQIAIKSQTGNTLGLNGSTLLEIQNNFGFFIQNHLGTIDKNGEWYFDAINKKMYLYYLTDPKENITEATFNSYNFEATNKQYFSLENLEFKESLKTAIRILNSKSIEVKNNLINESGSDAVNFIDCKDVQFFNNKIAHTNVNSLVFVNCRNIKIENNSIAFTGLRPGMGYKNFYANYIGTYAKYTGIYIHGNNIQCKQNHIEKSGYNAIYFDSDTTLIKNNYIDNFCSVLDDGGGIYTYNEQRVLHADRRIESNIILNGVGAGEGTKSPNTSLARGIFLDYGSDHVVVFGNTISRSNDYGIFNQYSNNNSIIQNTVYNNVKQLGFADHTLPAPITNYSIERNIFYSKSDSQLLTEFVGKTKNEILQFGTFDYNYYCRPSNEYQTIQVSYHNNSITKTFITEKFDLKTWQIESKKEAHSTISPYKLPMYNITGSLESNRFINGTFNTDISDWMCWSVNSNCGAIWDNSKLDGGCIKVYFTSPSGKTDGRLFILKNVGQVIAGEKYILKFSIISSHPDRNIQIALRQNYYPYKDVATSQNITLSTNRKEFELLFTPDTSDSNTRINIVINEDDASYWLDNISFYRANIQLINTEDSIKFLYNPNNIAKVINDGNYYIDAKGYKYHNFNLEPYSSLVLLKVSKEYYDSIPGSIDISSISVTSTSGATTITQNKGTMQLMAGVAPSDATDKSVTWSIQNGTGQATISVDGLVTAITNGTVMVIATANDGSSVQGTMTINITGQIVNVTGISISGAGNASSISIDNGTLQLTANVAPGNATNKGITWSIHNVTGQAIISPNGLVSAISNGTVRAIATATDGSGISGYLEITISNQNTSTSNQPVEEEPFSIKMDNSTILVYFKTQQEYYQVRLINLQGHLLINQRVNSDPCLMDISSIPPGLYILQLIYDEVKSESVKISKL